ncbi:hypothetical protein MMC08_005695 [Hypocenomyce scalaris]|nr:hypothetical protein [Hypocenomyce scalaris]
MPTPRVPSSLPATLFRGGTSKALMLHRSHLPADTADWGPILAGAMGSPDPYGRQLNGMGGGVSSLSKVCVIEKSEREEADVEFTFVQLGVKDGKVDMEGTCGNMTSAVGPWAFDEGLSKPEIKKEGSERLATVRIFNTNTNKIIHSRFAVEEDGGGEGTKAVFKPSGTYAIDGVPGTGSRIMLSFLSPGGSKTGRTLPTGNPVDLLHLPSGGNKAPASIRASLVDVANPAVFILAADLGIEGTITPDNLDKDTDTMALLEGIRAEGARLMGLDPSVESIPKITILSAAGPSAKGVDIVALTLSMGKTHKAMPLTIALNLGVTCQIPRTLAAEMVGKLAEGKAEVTVGHPSGKVEVGARMRGWEVESAVLSRTARKLMRGEVFWR